MQPVKIIDKILGNPIKVGVLRCLTLGCEGKAGRELARILSVSSPGILKPLHDLEKQGIIKKRVIGKSHSYFLNKNNIIVSKGIIPLFQLEKKLLATVAFELKNQLPKNIDSAIWHGSVAKGTAHAQSDWDILLLCRDEKTVKESLEILYQRSPLWATKYSTRLDIQAMTTESFRKKFRSGNAFAKNVHEDYIHSKVSNPLFGESLILLLGGQNDKKDTDKISS